MAKYKKTRLHLSSYAIDPERIERKANEMAKEGWLLENSARCFPPTAAARRANTSIACR